VTGANAPEAELGRRGLRSTDTDTVLADVAIETYIRHGESAGSHDPNRRVRLSKWAAAWTGRPLREIRHRDVVEFLIRRHEAGNTGSTVRRYYGHISAFFSWACANDYLAASPIRREHLKLPPENDPRARRLRRGEEARIRAHADEYLNDCMTMTLHTGLRIGTIRQIQFKHVRDGIGRHGALVMPASIMKQRKPHVAALTADTKAILDRRREARAHLPNLPEAFPFGNPHNGHGYVGTEASERRFRLACRKAGVSGLRFHDLRGEAASRLFEAGASLRTVQGFLGHTTLAMTERYLRPRVGSLDETVLHIETLVMRGVENAAADDSPPLSSPGTAVSRAAGDALTTPPPPSSV
jgi:integrase